MKGHRQVCNCTDLQIQWHFNKFTWSISNGFTDPFVMDLPIHYGLIHILWADPFTMGWLIHNGLIHTPWADPYTMGLPIHHGLTHTLWADPYTMGWPIHHGLAHTPWADPYTMGWPIHYRLTDPYTMGLPRHYGLTHSPWTYPHIWAYPYNTGWPIHYGLTHILWAYPYTMAEYTPWHIQTRILKSNKCPQWGRGITMKEWGPLLCHTKHPTLDLCKNSRFCRLSTRLLAGRNTQGGSVSSSLTDICSKECKTSL